MPRKVMQRVFEMIDEQNRVDPNIMKGILKVEQAYLAQSSTGALGEIESLISKAIGSAK
jgi:hypothetical protein